MEYCDLHTHLLAAVDDGPRDIEGSLKGARFLLEAGFRRIAVTPHRFSGLFPDSRQHEEGAIEQLRAAFASNGLPLEVATGAEYLFGPDLVDDFEARNITPLGSGRYFMVEFNSFAVQEFHKMFFFKVRAQGLKPVLAHPERSDIDSAVARDFFDYLMKNGALIQCDLLSLTGRWGRRAADNAMRLLHKGVVAAFATDIHCRESDFEELPGAIEQLRKAAGAEAAGRLLGDNPADILAGRRPRWISYDD